MKYKVSFFSILFVFTSLLPSHNANAQKKPKIFKSYLIVNDLSEKIQSDSLFNLNLKEKVKIELQKKNYVLVSNKEMEEAGRSYLYIYVNISDSLKISAKESSSMEGVYTIQYPEKIFSYKNENDLLRYIIQYIKNNL